MSESVDPAATGEYRVGDADREQIVQRLTAAVGTGHLGVDEADERIARAYAAVWRSELHRLTADLPPPQGANHQPGSTPARARSRVPIVPLILVAAGLQITFGHFLGPLSLPVVLLVLAGLLMLRRELHRRAS